MKRFASNAVANIFSGVTAAIYQLTVTGIGSSVWQGREFSAWALALSFAAIAPIFAANLSSVITRRVVEARHGKSAADESAIVKAGRRIGQQLTLLAIALLLCVGTGVQMLSGSDFLATWAFAILLTVMLFTNSWLLLWQVRFGQHFADERNWLPAFTLAGARLGGAAGMLVGLKAGDQVLAAAAIGLCVGTWIGLACARVLLPGPRTAGLNGFDPTLPEIQAQYRANLRLLSGFAVGAVSMLVIQYSISPLMALIAPQRFNAFYLASTLNAVAVSVLAAAMSAMLAPLTRWRAAGNAATLRRVALFSPMLCAISCFAILCVCWFAMNPVLSALNVRAASSDDIRAFLAILGYQTIIRNAAAGYAMYIASTGTSRQMAIPLLIEITLAFVIAVPMGWLYGEDALLYGLIFSGFAGSLYSSKIVASLNERHRVSVRTALLSLLFAQTAISGVWFFLVSSNP